jgi:hypothetical protein
VCFFFHRNIFLLLLTGSSSEERGLSRKHIIESIRASLDRLQLDYIDVVLIHRADPMCPMEGRLFFNRNQSAYITFNPLLWNFWHKQKWFEPWIMSLIMAGLCIGVHRAGRRSRFRKRTTIVANSIAHCQFANNPNIISSAEKKSKYPFLKSTIN